MKIGKVTNVNEAHRLYEVASTENARHFYQVRICTQPSCSCPDFNKQGSRVLCKHIFFVLIFILEVEDISKLDTNSFLHEDLTNMLKTTGVKAEFLKSKVNKKTEKKSKKEYKEIINTHPDANQEQTFMHSLKENRSSKCHGLNCKKSIGLGDPCVKVCGALTVPFGKDFAVKQDFYFCPSRYCVKRPPIWSNIKHPIELIKGHNISHIDYDSLKKELSL